MYGSRLLASTSQHLLKSITLLTIGETVVQTVYQFTSLGFITSDGKIDREIDNRLAKSNSAFSRLYNRVLRTKHLKKNTKISMNRAVVLTNRL